MARGLHWSAGTYPTQSPKGSSYRPSDSTPSLSLRTNGARRSRQPHPRGPLHDERPPGPAAQPSRAGFFCPRPATRALGPPRPGAWHSPPVAQHDGGSRGGGDEVQVFYADPAAVSAPDEVSAMLALLCPEERARYRRFRFDAHRHQYLVAHAVVRTTLAARLGISPGELRFSVGEHGKPALASQGADRPVHFNLSHTDGLVACAIGPTEIGVDVEHEDRRVTVVDVARSVFSPLEQETLRQLSGADQRRRFFAYWTLKESYIKAVGHGLSLPLRSISFHVEPRRAPRISFAPPIEDDAQAWRFALVRITARHPLAVAARSERSLAVRLRRWSLARLLG